MQQRIADLTDSSKQHWERICQLTSQVDTMQAFYKAYGENEASMRADHQNRCAARTRHVQELLRM
jgi:hypothetical protein